MRGPTAAGLVAWTVALYLAAAAVVHTQSPAPAEATGSNVLFGRLLDVGSDAPVAGAIVTLTGYVDPVIERATASSRTAERIEQHVMTSADGHFLFRGLPAGRYSLVARAFGYLFKDFPAQIVELPDGSRPTSVSLRVWKHATIAGRVTDERGEPVIDVPVTALHRKTVEGRVVMLSTGWEGRTDDLGEYRIAELSPGPYVVAALASTTSLPASLAHAMSVAATNRTTASELRRELLPSGMLGLINLESDGEHVGGFVLQRSGPVLPRAPDGRPLAYATTLYPGTTDPTQAAAITLASGEARAGVDLSLRFLPTVRVSGTAFGPDGPMRHLTLRLMSPAGVDVGDLNPVGIPTAVTDEHGAFAFLAVHPGEYVLRTSFVDGDFSTGEGVSLWASQALAVGDEHISGLSVRLQPGTSISGRAVFRGAPDGALPSASERVIVGLRPFGSYSWRSLSAAIRADGTFQTAGDPPGRYTLNAGSASGWMWESTSLGGRPLPDDVVELGNTDLSDLVLTFSRELTHVSGSIADRNGAAVPDADVMIFPADLTRIREGIFDSRRVRFVRASSAATFEAHALAPGEYLVAAVGGHTILEWRDPDLIERLRAGATRFTLEVGEDVTVAVRMMTLQGR